MASVSVLRNRESLKSLTAETFQISLILIAVFGFAAILVAASTSSGLKVAATVIGFCLLIAGAFISGNPRLYSLWGLMLAIPLTLSKRFGPMYLGKPGGEDSFKVEVCDIFLITLLGFLIWEMYTGRRKGFRIPKVTFAWMLLIGIGCIWILVGDWPVPAALEVFRMTKVMILFLVVVNELDRPGRIWHCTLALAIGAVGQSVVGLVQYFKRGLIGLEVLGETTSNTLDILSATSVQGESVFRPSALLQHPNIFGIYLALLIPVILGMLIASRKASTKVFFLIAVAVCGPGIIITLSRSSWVSAAIAVALTLLFTFLHPTLRWRTLVTGALITAVGVAILTPFIGTISQRLLNSKDDATIAREIYKEDAKRMIAAAPWIGHGLNSYSLQLPEFASMAMPSYGPALVSVHHIYYLWWSETGFIGLSLFLLIWGSIIWTGITNLGVRDEMLCVVNAACTAGIICLIPDGFLSFTLRVNVPYRIFWLFAGLILAIRYLRLREQFSAAMPETTSSV